MSHSAIPPQRDPGAPEAGAPVAGKALPKVRTAKAKPAEIVLVCRKCARRAGLSPKEARRLAKRASSGALQAAPAPLAGAGPRVRKAKVVETGCLGPCPKRLLAVATGAGLAAGRIALLDPRADPPGILPDFGPNAALPAPAGAGARSGEQASARDDAPTPP